MKAIHRMKLQSEHEVSQVQVGRIGGVGFFVSWEQLRIHLAKVGESIHGVAMDDDGIHVYVNTNGEQI